MGTPGRTYPQGGSTTPVTGNVDVVSSVLPTGAATEATLADVDTKAGTIATNTGNTAASAATIATNTGSTATSTATTATNTGNTATSAATIATNTGNTATSTATTATNIGTIATNTGPAAPSTGGSKALSTVATQLTGSSVPCVIGCLVCNPSTTGISCYFGTSNITSAGLNGIEVPSGFTQFFPCTNVNQLYGVSASATPTVSYLPF